MNYSPIYEKDGNRFIIPESNYVTKTKEQAEKIGSVSTLEQEIGKFTFTGEVLEFDTGHPHVEAYSVGETGRTKILIISGPMFEQ